MSILTSLGVDWTVFVHLICFGISFFFLTTFVLKPYSAAMDERHRRTHGNEELAVRIVEETEELQAKYEQKARALNAEIKGYFDESRTKAMHKYDEVVSAARQEAVAFASKAQVQVEQQLKAARESLSKEIPEVSAAIATKLAGKEISL
jgi:F-type H+-transporting ATPase subunit b